MRHLFQIGILVSVLAGGVVPSAAQDCTPQAHPERWWEIGRFYAHPNGQVIEVLAEICGGYDIIEIRPGYTQRLCVGRFHAVRMERGAPTPDLLYQARKVVVYKRHEMLIYATRFVPYPSEIGEWALVPQGCYTPSAVVSVVNDIVQVRVP